ncbi:MAG TPA: hypothetical protein VF065_01220 [Ilumatobacter sp.]
MQTNIAPTADLTDSLPAAESESPPPVWMFWAGIGLSCLGALVILVASSGLPVFDHMWSVGFVVASPLFAFVWLLNWVGVGLADETWPTLAIEISAGGVLCLIGAALLATHHVRELRAGCVGEMTSMPSNP